MPIGDFHTSYYPTWINEEEYQELVARIVTRAKSEGFAMREFICALVTSEAFQTR